MFSARTFSLGMISLFAAGCSTLPDATDVVRSADGAATLASTTGPVARTSHTAEGCSPGRVVEYPADEEFDLTGVWLSEGIDTYYIAQFGDDVWIVAMSGEEPQLGIGRAFTTVFKGAISGTTIEGEWADMPRRQLVEESNAEPLTGSHRFEVRDEDGTVALERVTGNLRRIVPCNEAGS